jgi:hypothetical protein
LLAAPADGLPTHLFTSRAGPRLLSRPDGGTPSYRT